MVTIIRTYHAHDGTALITYADQSGYINTVPARVFNKKYKRIKKQTP